MKRLVFAAAVAALAVGVASGPASADFPERPITMIVPWAAGGGTDAVARMLASRMEETLGQPINVVNRTGAGGVVGHTAMTEAAPDGYTIGLATAEITTYDHMGTSEITHEDLTPIALVNFDASAFNVNADSEWDDVNEALEAIRQSPGEYKMSGMPVGAAYHLAFAAMLGEHGIDPKAVPVVPSQGAAPGFQELAAGGVAIVPSSLPEAESMRQAGRVKTLAVLADERLEAYPDVPTIAEATGTASAGGTWRGIVGPAGLPDDVRATLAEALEAAWQSEEFQTFMKERGFGTRWLPADEFGAFMADAYAINGEVIGRLGLAQ